MNPAAPPDRSEARRSPARTFGTASIGGFVAFLTSALAGQLVGLAEWVAGARAFGARLPLKLGWLYLVSFHRVGIHLTSTQPFAFGDGPGPPPPGTYVYTIRVAVLAGTILAGVMLYRAGRAAARHAGARPWLGAAVAPAYAVPIFLGSLFVTLRFPDSGVDSIKPIAWEAFVFPFAFAAITGVAGGLSTARLEGPSRKFATWLRTGWKMFAVAVVLAFVGFVVLAGIRPDASGAYLRWIGREGRYGALVATHHLVLLPDQSLWVLAPAMGSCDSLGGGSSEPTTLCFRTFTVRSGWGELVFGPSARTELSLSFLLFMLIPAIAVVVVAARSITSRSLGARVVDAMASGVVFAAVVWLAAVVSRISIDNPAGSGGGALISAGPDPVRTGLFALAWGLVGGAIGAALPVMRSQGSQEGVGEPAPAPPRPTSV